MDGTTSIGLGRAEGYRLPGSPDTRCAERNRLDLRVTAFMKAEAECRKVGETAPELPTGGDRWRVMWDPEGRPFRLVPDRPGARALPK